MNTRPALDVSHLPAYAFGPRGLMWWGTMGMLTIEGTMFAMLIATYFYLRIYVPEWPPNLPPPPLIYGTANTLVLLISAVPNEWVKRGWHMLTNPLLAWSLHAMALWIWHAPGLFQAALKSEPIHVLQHLSFLVFALLFWWALIHGRQGGWVTGPPYFMCLPHHCIVALWGAS
jgi:cytochrome c oxidase assembly factor CtaG